MNDLRGWRRRLSSRWFETCWDLLDPLKMTCFPSYGFIDQLARALNQYHKGHKFKCYWSLVDPLKMTCFPSYGFIDQLARALNQYHKGHRFKCNWSLMDPLKMACSPSYGFIAQLVRALHQYHKGLLILNYIQCLQNLIYQNILMYVRHNYKPLLLSHCKGLEPRTRVPGHSPPSGSAHQQYPIEAWHWMDL